MVLPTALTHNIHQLLNGLSLDDALIVDPLESLNTALRTGIDSYCGLQLTVVDHGHHVTLTWFAAGTLPDDLTTSLHLPLTALLQESGARTDAHDVTATADPLSSITFYACVPGALVDLAADITYALHLPPPRTGPADGPVDEPSDRLADGHDDGQADEDGRRSPWRGITLDDGIPPTTLLTGLAGVAERSTIDRAIGLLLAEGFDTEPAFRELGRRAAQAGHSTSQHATELLEHVITHRALPNPD